MGCCPPTADTMVRASFVVNVLLAVLKGVAAGMSGSLAIITSLVDSLLDIASQTLFVISANAANSGHKAQLVYPVGTARFEPATVLVFSSVMGTAALTLFSEGVRRVLSGVLSDISIPVMASMGAVVAAKLALFIACKLVPDASGTVAALAEDHRNDVISNTLILAAVIGQRESSALWWLDGSAAMLASLWIMYAWGTVALEMVRKLSGMAPEPETLNRILQAAWDFCANDIIAFDTVRAYHAGEKLFVEVDIVMDADAPLRITHDLSSALQVHLETSLPEVERAFIHVDYETEHKHWDEHPGVAPPGWQPTLVQTNSSNGINEGEGHAVLADEDASTEADTPADTTSNGGAAALQQPELACESRGSQDEHV